MLNNLINPKPHLSGATLNTNKHSQIKALSLCPVTLKILSYHIPGRSALLFLSECWKGIILLLFIYVCILMMAVLKPRLWSAFHFAWSTWVQTTVLKLVSNYLCHVSDGVWNFKRHWTTRAGREAFEQFEDCQSPEAWVAFILCNWKKNKLTTVLDDAQGCISPLNSESCSISLLTSILQCHVKGSFSSHQRNHPKNSTVDPILLSNTNLQWKHKWSFYNHKLPHIHCHIVSFYCSKLQLNLTCLYCIVHLCT